jgi:RHS repeat-associated protein
MSSRGAGSRRQRTSDGPFPRAGNEPRTVRSPVYDALGRLSSARQTARGATVFDQQFTYDPLGNILGIVGSSVDPTTLTYSQTDRDRICRIRYGADSGTDCNVTYDEIGSIVTQATPTGQRQYSYLINGSVRTVSDERGTQARYRYGAFGEVQELELTSSFSTDDRNDRHYGDLITRRETPSETFLVRRIPGPDGFLATRRGAGGPWVFAFGEARGNRFFTDETGAFVQDVDYDPYGKPSSTGAEPGNRRYSNDQWNGGDLLAPLGISQLGARLYDPTIGRFLSRDPLLIPRTATTTNPYAFAWNDPVNGSDPTGLEPKDKVDKPAPPSKTYVFNGWDWPGYPAGPGPTGSDTSVGGGAGSAGGVTTIGNPTALQAQFDAMRMRIRNSGDVAAPVVFGLLSGAAVAAAESTGAAVAGGGAAATGAVGGGVLVGAGLGVAAAAAGSVVAALALSQVLPAPANAPSNCGDYNHACWSEYIDRAVTQARRNSVNLDVGTIIAVSQMGNPSLKATVGAFLAGKRLLLTRTAYNEFMSGPFHFAGPMETVQIAMLLMTVTHIADSPSSEFLSLPASNSQLGKMDRNDRTIFGTGRNLGVITSTGDSRAVTWALSKGVLSRRDVFLHPFARYAGR